MNLRARVRTAWGRAPLLLALAAGLYLAALPTYYTVFARQAENDPVWVRVVLFAGWLVCGGYVLWKAFGRDVSIERAMADRRAAQRQVRTSAIHDVLDGLVRPDVLGLPDSWELTIYVFDEETGFLEPYYPPANLPSGREDHRRFAPGRGATGRAWEEGRLFHVRGKRVANDEFNLTDEQRELFAGYQSVAATPLRDDHDRPFGVVTALSHDDDPYLESPNGQRLLRNIAETLGVVLTSVPDPDDLRRRT